MTNTAAYQHLGEALAPRLRAATSGEGLVLSAKEVRALELASWRV